MDSPPEPPKADNWDAQGAPWEGTGEPRRDCEPARGAFLLWLSGPTLVASVVAAAFVALGSWGSPLIVVVTTIPVVFLGAVGIATGIIAASLARQDLQEMTEGRRDPQGKLQTERARRQADGGVALLAAVLWVVFVTVVLAYTFGL